MAIQLDITDGTTTVTFTTAPNYLLEFSPRTPEIRTRFAEAVGIDGGEQDSADYENVTDSFHVQMGGSTATIRFAVQSLHIMFDKARRYRAGDGTPTVYIRFRPDGAESLYRSQILSGRVVWDQDALGYMFLNAVIEITVIVTRRFYWENNAEREIRLGLAELSSVGAYATGGIAIRNHLDATAGHANAVELEPLTELDAIAIAGDSRPVVRVELYNSTASSTFGTIYLSHEILREGAAGMTTMYEGENATGIPSSQSDGNSSGGNFGRMTWSGSTEQDIAEWQLPTGVLAAGAGKWFKAMARFANTFAYTDLWLRLKLQIYSNVVYQSQKQLMAASYKLQSIGSLPIPPSLGGLGTLSNISMILQATRTAGGSSTIDLDFMQMFALDGWRKYTPLNAGLANTNTLKDDGMNGKLYSLEGGDNLSRYTAEGTPPLLATSGVVQRLRVLWERSDHTAVVDDTSTLRLYYRDRRLAL